MIYGAHLIYMRIHFIDVCFKGILQDLTLLSFVLVEICSIFELLCFPPSFPPETRDLCIFLSGKNLGLYSTKEILSRPKSSPARRLVD